jgi:hypothetical protein
MLQANLQKLADRFVGVARVLSFLLLFSISFLVGGQQQPHQLSHDDSPIYIGLIEDNRRELEHLGPKDFGLVPDRNIILAFVKDIDGWKSAQQVNRKVRWTVAFDGKNLGEVESEPSSSSQAQPQYSDRPIFFHSILTSAAKIPAAGKPSGNFASNYGTDVRRPLVVVSKPNFNDPEYWKRTALPVQSVEQVGTVFRNTFRHVRRCDPSGEPLKADTKVADSEIALLRVYGSSKGSFVIETELKDHRCVFNLSGSTLQLLERNEWFYRNPDGEVSYLGRGWELVDAGDYDNDGKSEMIFYVAESEDSCCVETEGYILFWNDFRDSVRTTWKYRL